MEVLAQVQFSSLLFLAGLALVVVVLLLRVRRQVNPAPDLPERAPTKKKKPGYAAPPPVAPDRAPERTAEHWEVRLHELARDLLAQIETKTGVLQQFVRLADEQAARLERLLRQASEWGGPGGLAEPSTEAVPPPAEGEPAPSTDEHDCVAAGAPERETGSEPESSADGEVADDVRAGPATVPDAACPFPEMDESPVARLDRTGEMRGPHARSSAGPHDADDIYRLADYGMGEDEIARRVRRPVGEIRLILALRERRAPL